MLRRVMAVVAVAAGLGCAALAEDLTDEQRMVVANGVGRSRYLAQEAYKQALQALLKVSEESAKADVKRSIDAFEKQLQWLRKGDERMGIPKAPESLAAELGKVDAPWKSYKEQLSALAEDKADADKLQSALEALQTQLESTLKVAEGDLPGKVAAQMAVGMRLRVASQRLACLVYLVALGKNAGGAKKDLEAEVDKFEKSVVALQNGDPAQGLPAMDDPEIKSQLENLGRPWEMFSTLAKKAMAGEALQEDELREVSNLSIGLLIESNRLNDLVQRRALGQ